MDAPGRQESSHHLGKVLGVCVAAAFGGLLFGFDTSVINGALAGVQSEFGLGAGPVGLVVAVALLGCAVGAWFAGQLADRWGRRR